VSCTTTADFPGALPSCLCPALPPRPLACCPLFAELFFPPNFIGLGLYFFFVLLSETRKPGSSLADTPLFWRQFFGPRERTWWSCSPPFLFLLHLLVWVAGLHPLVSVPFFSVGSPVFCGSPVFHSSRPGTQPLFFGWVVPPVRSRLSCYLTPPSKG